MTTPASTQDLFDLIQFLERVRSVFRAMVGAREILFRKSVRDLFEKSHLEIEKDIEDVISRLQSSVDSGSSKLPGLLGEVGLSGVQLELKLTGFNRIFDRFVTRGTTKLLQSLLSWMNKILGSLIAAIPGAEAIKEFKEAAEEEMDDSDPF